MKHLIFLAIIALLSFSLYLPKKNNANSANQRITHGIGSSITSNYIEETPKVEFQRITTEILGGW